MRPGQTAPECMKNEIEQVDSGSASMRPGQTAPECLMPPRMRLYLRVCFNEAGADCPGMRAEVISDMQENAAGFNEAGADCPGMPRRYIARRVAQSELQ